MPGAYAHITLVHSCIDATGRSGGLSPTTVRALTTWRSHAELGAVSPDSAPADPTELDAVIAEVWTRALCQAHPQTASRETPAPRLWHHGFLRVMSTIRETNRLLPFARHLGVDAELDYPDPKDIEARYVQALPTPLGPMDYDPLLDRAIHNASRFWSELDAVLSGADPHRLDALPSWNLDTGLISGTVSQMVYWREG